MNEPVNQVTFALEPADNRRLASLCGPLDEHLTQVEQRLNVRIRRRGNLFSIAGGMPGAEHARDLLRSIYRETRAGEELTPARVHMIIQGGVTPVVDIVDQEPAADAGGSAGDLIVTRRRSVRPRGGHQADYVENLNRYDLNFAVGPAGTGKTYLAVAYGVQAMLRKEVSRMVLVRPAVEAGEKLGFLPGDLAQKVDPYLRPIYDALYEMLSVERVNKLLEQAVIEVAPLAYMRGRTLNDAFIILDEAQNTTPEQMKMFLTRIGFGAKAVVTGDVTQVDLSAAQRSGLEHVLEILSGTDGIGFNYFDARDVVRHPLVQRVIEAYERGGA